MDQFNYFDALSRNIGWVTKKEQLVLKHKTAAIAGMGGVGGFHLLTLCRLGIQNFHISDPDHFEIHNFNRQVGATMSSLNAAKSETLLKMAQDINPNVQITIFDAINKDNVHEFITGSDIYIDGMDFFAVEAREMLFKTCAELKIPAVTAAPIGMGVSYLIFDENGMTFNEYFQWDNKTEEQKLINFIIGLSPKMLQLSYLVDKSAVNFHQKKGPSTVMSCMLCAGTMGVQALKILLNRGKIYSAPYYHQFDPYVGKYKSNYLFLGNKNPIQRLKGLIVSKIISGSSQQTAQSNPPREPLNDIEKIIELARWAPSGDNTQPWRFKIISTTSFLLFIDNTVKNDFYDFAGKPTLISIGCLIESIALAANKYNQSITWYFNTSNTIQIDLKKTELNHDIHQLGEFLEYRSVDRTSFQTKSLPSTLPKQMQSILDEGYEFNLVTSKKMRHGITKMNMLGTQIRLVLKEAHETHKHVIQWDLSKTDFGIPYTITGFNKMTTHFMKLIFGHWNIMYFLNYHLGGAVLASMELDYLPAKNSAGYFVIHAKQSIDTMSSEELVQAGMQIQRVWLYLTKLNISVQPCYTPIILSFYKRNNIEITTNKKINGKLLKLSELYKTNELSDKTIFVARLGYPTSANKDIRSTRLPLDTLIL